MFFVFLQKKKKIIVGWNCLPDDLQDKIVNELLDFDDMCKMAKLEKKFNRRMFTNGRKILERLFDMETDEKKIIWDFFFLFFVFFFHFLVS